MYKFLNQEFLKFLKKLQIVKIPYGGEVIQIDAGFFGIFQKIALWYSMLILIWFTLHILGFTYMGPTWNMFYLLVTLLVINAFYIAFKGNELLNNHRL